MAPKWLRSGSEVAPKWLRSGPKVTPKLLRRGSDVAPTWLRRLGGGSLGVGSGSEVVSEVAWGSGVARE